MHTGEAEVVGILGREKWLYCLEKQFGRSEYL